MAALNELVTPSLTFEEILSDGSTLTNPAADSRRLFLGEDGLFHMRDSAGTVTDVGTGATRASLGLDTTDSPQFAGVNVGHASDTTLTRASAGVLNVEGNRLFAVGAADVPVADGGTGASTASGARTNLGLVLGTDVASLTAGVVPIAQLATGTPTGAKFIRDDGTLQSPSGGTAGTAILLDFPLASDITNQAITAGTAFDIIANQNFTVASATSIVEVIIRGSCFLNDAVNGTATIQVVIDSAGTPITKPVGHAANNSGTAVYRDNPFGGGATFYVSGLSAAVHTVKVQILADQNQHFYCRASTNQPYEFANVQVVEHKN